MSASMSFDGFHRQNTQDQGIPEPQICRINQKFSLGSLVLQNSAVLTVLNLLQISSVRVFFIYLPNDFGCLLRYMNTQNNSTKRER